ncbi:MAG: phytanoyl-CoA dioxygenase family protein, partial [Gemmatimonadetes bacterium]|nr:phytanoyl-CoA dioxygenase family protein [Gemmatimonadota bacterium]
LSKEEKNFLDAQGYLPLPGLLTPGEVAAFAARLEELAGEEGAEAGKEVHQEEGTTRLANLIDKDPLFEKCVTDRRLLAAVRHVIGGDLRLSSLNARASHPGQGLQGLHADWGKGVEPGEFQVCNSVWMLTDFTAENGATRVVPGSHLSRRTPSEAMEDPTDAHPEQVQLRAPAGTVVVFNGHLWHGGTFNASGGKRWGMHGYYCRRSVPQQTDQRRWLSPGTVARLSPEARAVVDVEIPEGTAADGVSRPVTPPRYGCG